MRRARPPSRGRVDVAPPNRRHPEPPGPTALSSRASRFRPSTDLPAPAEDGGARLRRRSREDIETLAARRARECGAVARPLAAARPADRLIGAGRAQRRADRLARRGRAVAAADRLAVRGDRPAGQFARPAFGNVASATETHDGVPVLVVEGAIVSAKDRVAEVPRLRFSVRNRAGQEVYAWTALPSRSVLAPGETLPFRSRLASPPPEAHDVLVRFFNRRDRLAGIQ